MKLQTRLSALLFFLLLLMSAGSALIVREALRTTAATQGDQLSQLNRRMQQSNAQQAAWLGARTLEALLEARLAEVSARGAALSAAPGPGEALANRAPEALRRVNDMLASARHDLRFQRLLDLNGQLALPPQPADSTWVAPPFSFLEPPALTTAAIPFQALLKTALSGTDVTSIEPFSGDLLSHLASEHDPVSTGPALILLAVHPVRGPDHNVAGAIVSGLDIAQETRLLEHWRDLLELKGSSAALVLGGTRIATVGDAWEKGSALPADAWKELEQSPQRIQEKEAALVRLPLRNRQSQRVAALEVQVPLVASTEAGTRLETADTEQWFQRALSWIGILGVLVLILGILGSRSVASSIVRLSRRADAVSTGVLETSFKDLMRRDEIGDLARSFERLRISLKKLLERQQRGNGDDAGDAPSDRLAGGRG
jgi:HAMP domain-containing protein